MNIKHTYTQVAGNELLTSNFNSFKTFFLGYEVHKKWWKKIKSRSQWIKSNQDNFHVLVIRYFKYNIFICEYIHDCKRTWKISSKCNFRNRNNQRFDFEFHDDDDYVSQSLISMREGERGREIWAWGLKKVTGSWIHDQDTEKIIIMVSNSNWIPFIHSEGG